MAECLKLLMIEDTPADFMLVERHLRTHGLEIDCTRVTSAPELERALSAGGWDALLSDYNVPGMDIEAVLQEVIRSLPDLPIILVSGSVGEEKAVELLKNGVWDFVLKDSLGRLVPSLQRALREVADRQALQLEQRRQRHLVENISHGIMLVDGAGAIFMTNPALDRMFGYDAGELLGQAVEVLVCEEDRATHVSQRMEYMHHPVPRYFWSRGKLLGRRRDGSRFPIDISLNPYQEDGQTFIQANISDETERTESERDLRIAATVFDVQEGVMVTDRNNHILRVNRAFTEITGYEEAEVIGRDPSFLKSGRQGPEFYRGMWATLLRDKRWAGELHDRRKDGEIYPKWLTISAVADANGDISHFVGVFSDLTKDKQAEKALAANAAKSEFLANMSHEIRTPMNGVVGMTDILQETALTLEQRRMVKTIRDSSLALLGILDDILDFSKIEAGKLSLESVASCLHELAEEVVRLLIPNAAAREIDLHLYIAPGLPLWVLADPLRLRQIMFNLLGNAIKFTQSVPEQRGKVVLRLEPAAQEDGAAVVKIMVIDNGIGISREALSHLFQPFTQADGSTTRRFGGTGLGLSITKRLVEMMQGSIAVRSTLQLGTEFTVTLPLQATAAGHSLPAAVGLGGVRVLAVVADDLCAEVLAAYLGSAGAEVLVTRNLEQAQQNFRQNQGWSVLVLDSPLAAAAAQAPGLSALPWVQLGRRGSMFSSDSRKLYVHKNPLLYHDLIHGVALASGKLSIQDVVGKSERRQRPRTETPTPEQAAAGGTLVLLAEDNDINREVIQQQLFLLGYASEAVADGLAALERWRSGRYGLLLTDCHMPKMDGFQLTAAIRAAEPAGIHLPIVAVTANALQGEAERCLEAGMDGYLSKPVRLDELGAMMASQLPLKAAAEPPAPPPSDLADGEAPVWDVHALSRLVGNQPELHHRLLDKFLVNAEKQMASIWVAANEGNAALVAEVAHKLKSAARSVGAMALGGLCEQLENAGRRGDLQVLCSLTSTLGTAYADFTQRVRDTRSP